jgi:hypothetical protein
VRGLGAGVRFGTGCRLESDRNGSPAAHAWASRYSTRLGGMPHSPNRAMWGFPSGVSRSASRTVLRHKKVLLRVTSVGERRRLRIRPTPRLRDIAHPLLDSTAR